MSFKEKVEIVGSFVTMAAIVIGGIWTYRIFIKERQEYPHANIELKASHVPLNACFTLVRVGVELANSGTSHLVSKKSIVRVQQIVPVPECRSETCARKEIAEALKDVSRKEDRFSWKLLAERENSGGVVADLEPGEKQEHDFEFVIPSDVQVVRLYSYFQNDARSDAAETGWIATNYYRIGTSPKEVAKCKQRTSFE